jgi:hypothetical protein
LLTRYELPLIPSKVRIVPGMTGRLGGLEATITRNRLNAITKVNTNNWKREMLASPVGSLINLERSISPT